MDKTNDFILGGLNHIRGLPLYEHERPYEIWLDENDAKRFPEDKPKTNVSLHLCEDIPLYEMRALGVHNFTLDDYGFQIVSNPMPENIQISGDSKVNASPAQRDAILAYLDLMSKVLCEEFGLSQSRAICYDWRVRQAKGTSPASYPRLLSLPDDVDARKYTSDVARQVHADASPNGIKSTINYVLNETERDSISTGKVRARVINLWRPLVPIVLDEALALCDRRSVQEEDWYTLDKVHTRWIEESMYMKHSEEHEWYYLKGQTKDEVTAMLIWDSHMPHQRSASVAHSAVKIPGAPRCQPRESIEARFILLDEQI